MPLFGRPSADDQRRAEAWRDWLRSRNPLAIASLVLGIFSLIEFGALLVFGIAGIALGVAALIQLRRAAAERPAPAAVPETSASTPAIEPNPYEAPDLDIPRIHGHRLAWTGIGLSILSLAAAAYMYLAPHVRRP
jgi:hypothetical protein